jgi:hypothetical protein
VQDGVAGFLDSQYGSAARPGQQRGAPANSSQEWLQAMAGPVAGASSGIRLSYSGAKTIPRKVRDALPVESRTTSEKRAGLRSDSSQQNSTELLKGPVDWSRQDQALEIKDREKNIVLKYYGARYLLQDMAAGAQSGRFWAIGSQGPGGLAPSSSDSPELWFRHMVRSDWGWQRIDDSWTVRETPDGTLLELKAVESSVPLEPAVNESKDRLVTIRGLSTNLTGRDFHRISSKSLSSWIDTIHMGEYICLVPSSCPNLGMSNTTNAAQQERDPVTFEPLGVYKLSFPTGLAATSYVQDLENRHSIAKAKFKSISGLWENSMSQYLRKWHNAEEEEARAERSSPDEDTTTGPDAFTIAPPSVPSFQTKTGRMATNGWQKALEGIVKQISDTARPPVVLVDVHPPRLSAEQLDALIKRDEQERGVSWHASKVVSLASPNDQGDTGYSPEVVDWKEGSVDGGPRAVDKEAKEVSKPQSRTPARDEVRRRRFVIAFPTDVRAARFHRSWHQQTLGVTEDKGEVSHYTISVQTVRW